MTKQMKIVVIGSLRVNKKYTHTKMSKQQIYPWSTQDIMVVFSFFFFSCLV